MEIEPVLKEFKRQIGELYGARLKKVVLYGSYARGQGNDEHSDIDLAAEGFASDGAPFRAAAELDALARPFTVDLVPFEDARPGVRARVLKRGELLYDRDQT